MTRSSDTQVKNTTNVCRVQLVKYAFRQARKRDLVCSTVIEYYKHIFLPPGVSSRDLSPVELVREYWSDCKDEMVEDMERIYER